MTTGRPFPRRSWCSRGAQRSSRKSSRAGWRPASEELRFENAAELRDRIRAIDGPGQPPARHLRRVTRTPTPRLLSRGKDLHGRAPLRLREFGRQGLRAHGRAARVRRGGCQYPRASVLCRAREPGPNSYCCPTAWRTRIWPRSASCSRRRAARRCA